LKAIRHIFILVFTSYFITSGVIAREPPGNFRQAKKALSALYREHPVTFYCGCGYALKQKPGSTKKRLTPDLKKCGYQVRKNQNRANRIEWEHVMPAYHFGHQRQCWQAGGRKACKKDPAFNRMEADMHNLVPSIGEVNGDRSNFKYGMIEGENRRYGACDFEIDFKAKRAEPAPTIRGDIARIYFYMRDRYQLNISRQQTQLFEAWSKDDPVDEWERIKNQKVMTIQGNANPYIKETVSSPED
jgi:deoxyribonuclease-1